MQRPFPDPNTIQKEMRLRDELQKIAVEFPGYGYRRVTVELHNRGYLANHKKVLRLMEENNLLCIKKRFKPLTTESNHPHKVYPNFLHIYLLSLMSFPGNVLVGSLENIWIRITRDALHQALRHRWHPSLQGLIHHSDQGVQYASTEYVNTLKDHGIQISISREGNPYDNAFTESFIKTLKYEEFYLNEYDNISEVGENVGGFIEIVYNKKRLHSSLGYKSPEAFEMQEKTKKLT